MIVSIIRTILLQDTGVASFFGDKVWPYILPEAPSFPAAVITKAAGVGDYELDRDSGIERARIQIDVYVDKGYAELEEGVLAIRRRLSGFQGGVVGFPCVVDSCMCTNDVGEPVPSFERAGPSLRRRMLEFTVWNRGV